MTAIAGPADIFQPGNPLSTLAAARFQSESAEARGISVVVNPAAFTGLQNAQLTVLGASADLPSVIFQPIQLSIANLVQLAEAQTGLSLSNSFFLLSRNASFDAVITREPSLSNPAADTITAAFRTDDGITLIQVQEDAAEAETAATTSFQFINAQTRPSENFAFGTTFSSVTEDTSLNAIFDSRVGVSSGASVALSDLILRATDGAPTDFAVRLLGENRSEAAGRLTQNGSEIGDDVVIAAEDLDEVFFEAPTGTGLDTISFIELRDDGDDGSFDGRGAFQTLSVSFAGEAESRRDGDERIRDFTFAAEPGTAQTRLVLDVTGIDSEGFTNALDAINGGVLRVQVSETRSDGTINRAVTSLLESDGETIIANFAFSPTVNGASGSSINVELRSLDLDFDISDADVRATFA